MQGSTVTARRRVFVAINPGARTGSEVDLDVAFGDDQTSHERVLHRLTPRQRLSEVAREAARAGFHTVVAAGGDGTVAAVASGLVGTKAALGIIPLGTSNVLARELGIPLDPKSAAQIVTDQQAERDLDGLKVEDRFLFTQIGIGINALAISGASKEHKRRFGRLAYAWAGIVRLVGYNPTRFSIRADDQVLRCRAIQVMVINSSAVGTLGIQWGADVRSDDGVVEVCVMRGRTVGDYVGMWWSLARGAAHSDPRFTYLRARRTIQVITRPLLPIQGDGEMLGKTPLTVEVIPKAVRVIVPRHEP